MPIRAQDGLSVNGSFGGSAGLSGLVAGNQAAMQDQAAQGSQDSATKLPWVVMAVVIAYLVYAIAIQHEKVKSAVQPANVAANAHNLVVIGFAASIFIVVMKTLWAKMTAWGFPGAASIAKFFMAV